MTAPAEPRPRRRLVPCIAGPGVLVLSFALLVACGERSPYLTVRDRDGRVADTSEIEVYRGEEHCGWQKVTFLRLGSRAGEEPHGEPRTYVRDPDGVLAHQTLVKYDGSTTLPNDARFTGYTSDAGTFWFARDDQDTVAYVVSNEGGKHVEVWPRTKTIVGCD
jgi:hypothetical protein